MNMNTEPAIIISSVGALISAAVPLLARTFGWTEDLSAEWEIFLLAAWTVISFLVVGWLTRGVVFSPQTYNEDVEAAKEE